MTVYCSKVCIYLMPVNRVNNNATTEQKKKKIHHIYGAYVYSLAANTNTLLK